LAVKSVISVLVPSHPTVVASDSPTQATISATQTTKIIFLHINMLSFNFRNRSGYLQKAGPIQLAIP
jgi:hypothetical protein